MIHLEHMNRYAVSTSMLVSLKFTLLELIGRPKVAFVSLWAANHCRSEDPIRASVQADSKALRNCAKLYSCKLHLPWLATSWPTQQIRPLGTTLLQQADFQLQKYKIAKLACRTGLPILIWLIFGREKNKSN